MDWFGVVDDELELVWLQRLKKSASAEHLDLFVVHALSV